MGFFDWLLGQSKPSNLDAEPDRIWLSSEAKFVGLAEDLAQRTQSSWGRILLVAHFPDVLARLETLAAQTPGAVKAVLARDLTSELTSDMTPGVERDETASVDVLVAERHPLLSVDEELAKHAVESPCRCRLTYHISIEDPVVQLFAGAWIQGVLSDLGMTADDAIASDLVVRRIKQAQRKVQKMATGNTPADSASQWLEKNCPQLSGRRF